MAQAFRHVLKLLSTMQPLGVATRAVSQLV
jgi:hypothetical protein